MRRFAGFLASVSVLALVAFVGFNAVSSWLEPPAVSITTEDGRPLAKAVQPLVPDWIGTLDNSGYDVSFPQCKQTLPSAEVGFAVVGLNYGKPFSQNPCFAQQWTWALKHQGVAVYINVADPGKGSATRYGARIASDTIKRLKKLGVASGTPVWLDIETANTWTEPNRAMQVINETMLQLTQAGHPVGIYAPPVHWFEITLNAVVQVPVWLALGTYKTSAAGVADAKIACEQMTFGDALPSLVQFTTKVSGHFVDHNLMCGAHPAGLFAQTQ